MTAMRAVIIAALISVTGPTLANTVTCSAFISGHRVCDDGHGHRCIEWERTPAEDLVAHPPPDPDCPLPPHEEKK